MQNLEAVVNSINLGQPQPKQRLNFEIDSPVMTRLWLRMTEMYGQMWSNSQGMEPNETWAIGLNDIMPYQISTGLTALRDSAKPFPPTLPEFIGMCRDRQLGVTARDKEAFKIWNPPQQIEDLTKKEENKLIGKETLADLQSLFQ